jgi:hypothetical protein
MMWIGIIMFVISVIYFVMFLLSLTSEVGDNLFPLFALFVLAGIFLIGVGIKQKTVFSLSDMREKEIITIIVIEPVSEELKSAGNRAHTVVRIKGERLIILLSLKDFYGEIAPEAGQSYIKIGKLLQKISKKV